MMSELSRKEEIDITDVKALAKYTSNSITTINENFEKFKVCINGNNEMIHNLEKVVKDNSANIIDLDNGLTSVSNRLTNTTSRISNIEKKLENLEASDKIVVQNKSNGTKKLLALAICGCVCLGYALYKEKQKNKAVEETEEEK